MKATQEYVVQFCSPLDFYEKHVTPGPVWVNSAVRPDGSFSPREVTARLSWLGEAIKAAGGYEAVRDMPAIGWELDGFAGEGYASVERPFWVVKLEDNGTTVLVSTAGMKMVGAEEVDEFKRTTLVGPVFE